MRNIKGIIFDLDGVIVSTDELHYQAWKKIADQENIYFDREINHRLRGVSRMASMDVILENAKRLYSDAEKLQLTNMKNAYYQASLNTLSEKDILPGFLDLRDELERRGLKIAIGSSSRNASLILEKIGLAGQFDAIADGNHITFSKPDPEVFLLAARMLQLLPEECAVIEDAEAGIRAACAMGAKPVAVGAAMLCDGAEYSIHDLSEIDIEQLLS